jgi:hypothetical protein
MLQSNNLNDRRANILASLGLRQQPLVSGKTPKSRLLDLSLQLSQWNAARNAAKAINTRVHDLSIDDVDLLKEIIHSEIKKTSVKHAEVVSDQILFLVIGAIQIQSQNHSADAWKLVDQSIQNFLKPEQDKRILIFSMLATLIAVIGISAALLLKPQASGLSNEIAINQVTETLSAGDTDAVTVSMLLLVYNKMKDGTCQLPQAAMLPQEQREAYLAFINQGVVDVRNVADLKLALAYVNCLYPQQLMNSLPITSKLPIAKELR